MKKYNTENVWFRALKRIDCAIASLVYVQYTCVTYGKAFQHNLLRLSRVRTFRMFE